jgi:Tannase and feruloyl esterase
VAAGDVALGAGDAPRVAAAAHCRVVGMLKPGAKSEVNFEVWLPAGHWNGRYEASGNGGYAGYLNVHGLAGAVARGSVGSTTDTGHQEDGKPVTEPMSWAYEHDRVLDYGHRAIHATALATKAIIRAYYGQAQRHAYFASCSNGGRQALMEAQRYPQDFDGIIAGAPANGFTRLLTAAAISQRRFEMQPETRLLPEQVQAVQRATLAACDARDGIEDGLVNDPRRCDFAPQSLACAPGASSNACLSVAQLQTLNLLYGRGAERTPHFEPGTETDSWIDWVIGRPGEPSFQVGFGMRFFRDFVHRNPRWGLRDFDLARDPALAKLRMAPILDATDTDLSSFTRRGGKLIIYHGWADAAIPAGESIQYFDAIGKTMGIAKRDAFARLYLVPGMTHCAGGNGFTEFGQLEQSEDGTPSTDIRMAMRDWVESQRAPGALIARRGKNAETAAPMGTRPLCAYPSIARWSGSGSTDEAANFSCVTP